jgi:hypothetical protein
MRLRIESAAYRLRFWHRDRRPWWSWAETSGRVAVVSTVGYAAGLRIPGAVSGGGGSVGT